MTTGEFSPQADPAQTLRMPVMPPAPFDTLTGNELHVVELASRGQTAQEAAETLYLNARTVKNYRSYVIGKVGAQNMLHVVRLGCESGLFAEPLEPEIPPYGELNEDLIETLNLFSLGYNPTIIGRELDVAPRTARVRKTRIIESLGAKTFENAVRLGWEKGILHPDRGLLQ